MKDKYLLFLVLWIIGIVILIPMSGIIIWFMFNPHGGLIPTLYNIQFMRVIMDLVVNFIAWLVSFHVFVALIVVTCLGAVLSWLMKKLEGKKT